MKVPNHHSREQVSMSDLTNARGLAPSMDKARRMLSPGTRKKLGSSARTFNVPLGELVHRAPQGYKVPYIVKKICTFIEHQGLDHEGIFRVNGSQRVVEKLKCSFDIHGDANLDEDNDMMAIAGLLKLFLRELPESCIPERMTRRYVALQEEHQRNAKECVSQLKVLLKELPDEHYDLLKHIIRFLAIVACNEAVNRMSPMALAIVFGPNLFRCGKGFLALKDQGSTNQIVYRFVVEYNSLFKDATEDTPTLYWSKLKSYDGIQVPDIEEPDYSESSISSKGRYSHSYSSPNFSDDEMTGRLSPFHLDSDSGFSLVESPVPSARTSEFVDKAIKATVIGHLFGDESSLLNACLDTTIRENLTEPGTDTKEVRSSNEDDLSSTPRNMGVKERLKVFEKTNNHDTDAITNPSKEKPKSKAFEMCENKGIIITQMHDTGTLQDCNNEAGEELMTDQEVFEKIKRTSNPLLNFKRPSGPQNRRSPSRRLRQTSLDTDEETMDEQDEPEVIANGIINQNGVIGEIEHQIDTRQHEEKSRIAFLDIRYDKANSSPDKSPSSNAKPFVPPLDFSTLHENVGGHAPISAQKAQSVSYQHVTNVPSSTSHEEDKDENVALLSPHANKIKRKAGHGSTDDELTSRMKTQMRKVQGLKKKIRQFEEAFEMEHGFKPSHAEKAAKSEIKKFMMELSRARKEAKKLKEEAEMGSRSRHGSGASSTGERTEPPDLPPSNPSMAYTLDIILKKLKEKRKEAQRPEDIELMNHDQVQEEKLAVQKALLHFEGIHGRPKTKHEKDLMRPLYDRYRTIKRLLSRQPMSPRGNLELQPVPEDKPIDIHSKFEQHIIFDHNKPTMPIRVPTADMENEDVEDQVAPLGTMEFAVTRDFSILKSRPVPVDDQGPHSPKARRKLEMRENIENRNTTDSNLHELTVPELQDELIRSRNSKKKLRKTLRDFEEGFHRKTGRKVVRDDRIPMQTEYNEYKQLKARLKLLEALLSKHHISDF